MNSYPKDAFNAILGCMWMESLISEQFGPIVWEKGYEDIGRKNSINIELLLYVRQPATAPEITYDLMV